MFAVNETIRIPWKELTFSFARSGGPGGQNVNKTSTKAILRWSVSETTALPESVHARFVRQQANRITKDGDLLLTSERYRDQERNKQDCLEKLRNLVQMACIVPKKRKKTKPSRAAKARRVANKRHRSTVKALRRPPARD